MESSRSIKRVLLTCLIMIAAGVIIQIVFSNLLNLVFYFLPDLGQKYSNMVEQMVVRPGVMQILYVAVLAPVVEELIFRLGIMGLAGKWLPFAVANVIQAVLFGLYHWNPVQSVYAFLLGMIIGYAVHKSGDVRYGMLLHIAINVSGLLIA